MYYILEISKLQVFIVAGGSADKWPATLSSTETLVYGNENKWKLFENSLPRARSWLTTFPVIENNLFLFGEKC